MLDALANLLPVKIRELEAKLHGVAGYTGRGEIEISYWRGGRATFEVELKGVAGLQASFYLNSRHIVDVPLDNGYADVTFDTRRDGLTLDAAAGDIVAIRQNGNIILEGILYAD